MREYRLPLFFAFFVFCLAGLPVQGKAQDGQDIHIAKGQFLDENRSRTIPYKVYTPQNISSPLPVIIFSHGLGGSVEAAPYLGAALARHDYIAFHIQHPGSDEGIWKGKKPREAMSNFQKALKDGKAARDRYNDVPFVINELTKLNQSSDQFRGKLDLSRIGIAGHSYGARSVMAAAGEANWTGNSQYKEPRIKAGIALSPNVPDWTAHVGKDSALKAAYSKIDIPVFHITGTEDGHGFKKDFDPATRTIPYQNIDGPNQYLLVVKGADHKSFGGGTIRHRGTDYSSVHSKVIAGAVLFFDAYIKGDRSAEAKLQNDYARTSLSGADRFEFK